MRDTLGVMLASPMRLPEQALDLLRCPVCRGALCRRDDDFICKSAACCARYPIIRGVPALLPPGTPLLAFRNDFDNRPTRWRQLRAAIRRRLPNIVLNVGGRGAIVRFLDILRRDVREPVILNIGEKHAGPVMRELHRRTGILHIQADSALGPQTHLLADILHLPFADGSIDAVVIDSGLEHIADPPAAVREIRRVLSPRGMVYIDLPFMMPVHAGASDFHRFTSRGLRTLFRAFDEIESGVSCGPAMALTQQTQYTLLSFVRRQWARIAVKLVVRFTLFWLKYLDWHLARRPGAMDAAGGTYFIGRKAEREVSDDEIADGYRGIVPSMFEPLERSDSG